jgi:hypothetical protein
MLTPGIYFEAGRKRKLISAVSLVVIILSGVSFVRTYNRMMTLARTTAEENTDLKKIQVAVADFMDQSNKNFVLTNFITSKLLNRGIWLESCYRHNRRPDYLVESSFYIPDERTGEYNYPDKPIVQLSDSLASRILADYNFIISFDDPAAPNYTKIFPDQFSGTMARILAKKIAENPGWKKVFHMPTSSLAEIAFFVKINSQEKD